MAGSKPAIKREKYEDGRQCPVCPLPETKVTPAADGSAVGGTADWDVSLKE